MIAVSNQKGGTAKTTTVSSLGVGLDNLGKSVLLVLTYEPLSRQYVQKYGITDPEYSIDCGVRELKSCIKEAKATSPIDMEKIKLALQSYNLGNAYLT